MEDRAMSRCRLPWGTAALLAAATMLSGCYYDPATGYTYAYPPPPAYGAPPPAPGYGGPGYGAPPEAGYGAPPEAGYGAPPEAGYGAPPGPGYGAPPAVGYGAPPAPGPAITRDQFIETAAARAQAHNRDPQRAAQHAGVVFDEIDINHTGVVTRAQIRAWREAHRPPPNPPPQYN
jgi:hypothetical protein